MKKNQFISIIVIAGLAGAIGALVLQYLTTTDIEGNLGKSEKTSLSQNAYASPIFLEKSQKVSDIAERAVHSVVNISSIKVIRYRQDPFFSPFFNDPFFKHFFGDDANPFGVPRERRQRSLGSGVIVSKDGHILTNNHVVANASEVLVLLSDQTELEAKIIGTDPSTDLALLQINLPKSHKPLTFGNSDKLRLAEPVLAIGSPFGLGGTVTLGIVSAKGRASVGIADYEDFIQTDAAINPGNSGGALLNMKGELIGINTAIYSKSGGYQGIGFAIPINMADFVMKELINNGKVERGWLGIRYQDVNTEIAKALKLKKVVGALVSAVYKNSPAQKAGIKPGDIILQFGDDKIRNSGHLNKLLSESAVGKPVDLTVLRNSEKVSLKVVIEKQPQRQTVRKR